jgi:hypothetical protein
MSLARYTGTKVPPAIANIAVLTLLARRRSAPFMIMHMKISVLEDAVSGMYP